MIPILEDTTIADVLKTFEDYYTKKDYLNALLVLQKGGKEISPKVKHYNLGTVYAKMQNWPMARYHFLFCLLYTSPSPRDGLLSRMPSSA